MKDFINEIHQHFETHPQLSLESRRGFVLGSALRHQLTLSDAQIDAALDARATAEDILNKKEGKKSRTFIYTALTAGLAYLLVQNFQHIPNFTFSMAFSEANKMLENKKYSLSPGIKLTLQMLISYMTLCYSPRMFTSAAITKLVHTLLPQIIGDRATVFTNIALCFGLTTTASAGYSYNPYLMLENMLSKNQEYGYAAYLVAPAYTLAFETARPVLFSVSAKMGSFCRAFFEAASEFSDMIHDQGIEPSI